MQNQEFEEEEEKLVDVKGTIESFIEEEKPELSQQEAIKLYKNGKIETLTKKRKKIEEDEENEDDEHMKRVKKALLESLERVKVLEKQIFEEEKENLKDIKIKVGKNKEKEKIIEQMREKIQDEKGRSREE